MKLFWSTFVLIFLAELGDKTQLAAMARSGASGSRWTVFGAASAALVCSTLIAVLIGDGLSQLVPEKWIKLVAGILFIIFGMLLVLEFKKTEEVEEKAAAAAKPGLLASVVFNMAAEFEAAAADDYSKLAETCEEESLKKLLLALADEERDHLERVKTGDIAHPEAEIPDQKEEEMPAMSKLAHDVAARNKPIVEHAIEHELATARFYEELSQSAAIPSLKETFAVLAAEEFDHAKRLQDYLDS